MFKSIIPAIAVAAVLAVPAFAQAQENAPVTRAEVKAQLVQLERAGYNPASDQTQYPANIQAAQARLNAQQGTAASSFGGAGEGAAASGAARRAAIDPNPVDFNRP
ncbi:DUF4148 domain-containing protein [Caballeronia sp. GACF4]|uniref:DUF4148 domain-containing protein n=1 Tax=Caballeronia sp. GACF4 TaxID=2921763 RepID=UPI0020288AFB|nr:DUF4148 domain-containing protein [Caballeronia sp. GACF4]